LKREFDEKKWLNLNFKPDNNCVNREDIILVSEIITYSRYWLSVAGTPPNLGPILKHITVSAEMQIISIIAKNSEHKDIMESTYYHFK